MSVLDATVGISVSPPGEAELATHGVSNDHVRHLSVELARQVLAAGGSLAYGGDLREGGFTRTLLALLRTYSREDRPDSDRVRFYLGWPVWHEMKAADRADLALYGTTVQVDRADDSVAGAAGIALDFRAMRERMTAETDARIVIGGRLAGQSGRWPGIAEEAYLALRAGQPLFIVGGLGGTAERIVQALRDDWPAEFTTDYQLERTDGYEALLNVGTSEAELRDAFTAAELRNGLDEEENELLFQTADLDLIVALILRGLSEVVVAHS